MRLQIQRIRFVILCIAGVAIAPPTLQAARLTAHLKNGPILQAGETARYRVRIGNADGQPQHQVTIHDRFDARLVSAEAHVDKVWVYAKGQISQVGPASIVIAREGMDWEATVELGADRAGWDSVVIHFSVPIETYTFAPGYFPCSGLATRCDCVPNAVRLATGEDEWEEAEATPSLCVEATMPSTAQWMKWMPLIQLILFVIGGVVAGAWFLRKRQRQRQRQGKPAPPPAQ